MFQFEWGNRNKWKQLPAPNPYPSNIDKRNIRTVLAFNWEEHCQECAMTACYSTCTLYSKRADGNCARFEYGIIANSKFKGLYNFGADMQFKKWGKLEASLYGAQPVPLLLQKWPAIHKHLVLPLRASLKRLISPARPKEGNPGTVFDEFVLECYSPEDSGFNLLLEYFVIIDRLRTMVFRHSFLINPGPNYHHIPFSFFQMTTPQGYISLYPENDEQARRIIITCLDFVKYKNKPVPHTNTAPPPSLPSSPFQPSSSSQPSSKIKCVVWDLDNTLWEGIISEDTGVKLREDALCLIRKFDSLGILQSIVSKNIFGIAWQQLEKAGISEYFLYPAINLGQKSENLIQIAQKLNIDLNTFAVIDDSAFERAEIKKALPQVRVYDETQLLLLLSLEEFDVPVSPTSKYRRQAYQIEATREGIRENFSGSYDEFLISCAMELKLFIPRTDADKRRCWELIQRSNQLNISYRRHTQPEFDDLLANEMILSLALDCRDRFGDYGLIGYVNINFSSGIALLEDLVISCRVAQKKIEHTLIKALAEALADNGHTDLYVKVILSGANKALEKAFDQLPFETILANDQGKFLKLSVQEGIRIREVMKLVWEDAHTKRPLVPLPSVR